MNGILKVGSIHLLMGGISLLLYFITLTNFTHSQAIIISLVSFFLNLVGYLILSFKLLQGLGTKEVIVSVFLFLVIGLLLWVSNLAIDDFGSIYFLYHIAGYSSFIWFVYLFTDMNEMLYEKFGFIFSLVPFLLILIGFYLGRMKRRG
ncbi:hypothetical protein [Alkalihalobacillus deserti]|uniref:hypothetical protein n=1 Tax=Alkalihalobacillus deserti TaxID=2879466 RepID=UPI001D1449B1|nr:hypothetical protein [Alkalihalobacillus deserti]